MAFAKNLDSRLEGVMNILRVSNRDIMVNYHKEADSTGFVAINGPGLYKSVLDLVSIIPDKKRPISLDLGCGDGAWTLMAAAAGFPSYGIDCNEFLINKARENYAIALKRGFINPDTICKFAPGNFYPKNYQEGYKEFAYLNCREENANTMPIVTSGDPYNELGISIKDAGIVYRYLWPIEIPFLCNFLNREVKTGALIILPNYLYRMKELAAEKLVDSIARKK